MKVSDNSGSGRDDEVKRQPVSNKKCNMFTIVRELCFAFAVLFTAYASLLNSQHKTKKATLPVPFFWSGSVVEDFYKGDLNFLLTELKFTHLSFVMYYAPWDADSRDMRNIFEEVAQFYQPEVYFASINCWQPGSECKAVFKSIPKFPKLVAYLGPKMAVEYSGPLETEYLIKFIDSLVFPLQRVNSVSEIWKLRFQHDALLVGFLKLEGNKYSRSYEFLYNIAWRMAGNDPTRKIAFAVLTHDRINSALGVDKTPTLVLYLWNKRMEYSGEMKVVEVMKWLIVSMEKLSLLHNDFQSFSLDENRGSSIVVAMFAPANPLSSYNSLRFSLMKAAMKFYGCREAMNSSSDMSFYNHLFNGQDVFHLYEEDLHRTLKREREDCLRIIKKQHVTSCKASYWANNTCYQHSCPVAVLRNIETPIERFTRLKCQLYERSGTLDNIISVPNDKPSEITSCQVNSTVHFLYLDPEFHPQFMQTFSLLMDTPTVIIFNEDDVMKLSGLLSEKRISSMISQFVEGKPKRHIRRTKARTIEHHQVVMNDLNSANFQPVVFNSSQTVLVYYYSRFCGSCRTASLPLLRLSHILRFVPPIAFARIDSEFNDLPYFLQVDSYPTLIIFPAHRKSESRVFPAKQSWTINNILQFLVLNLEPQEQVLVMLSSCSRWGNNPMISNEGDSCIREVRSRCMDLISSNLRQYRTLKSSYANLFNESQSNSHKVKRLGGGTSSPYLSNRSTLLSVLSFMKYSYLKLAVVTDIEKCVSDLWKIR